MTNTKPMAPVRVPMSTPTPPGLNGQGRSQPRGNDPLRYAPDVSNRLPPGAFHKR